MNKKIWLSLAKMGGREREFIREAFETNWVAPLGPNVTGFEKDLEAYFDSDTHIVALSSGTAAIHLALIQLGVEPGDEVICQSFTFVASANPITYLGASPVFVDSEPDTWNMSPEHLRRAIADRIAVTGRKPKAIIPVHLYGMPANMDAILAIAEEYDIPVLEDAAEALGSIYKNQHCGTFGAFACLSFNGNKMITTSGGGALVCKSREAAHKTLFYATQARDQAPHYQHSEIGYNYRMSNVSAGIGRGQMFVLDDHIAHRRSINALYRELFRNVKGISVHQEPNDDYNSNHWLTCITLDTPLNGHTPYKISKALDAEDIESRPLWKPLHLQPVFEQAPFYGDGTSEHLFNRGLCLPSGPHVSEEDAIRVVEVIREVIRND